MYSGHADAQPQNSHERVYMGLPAARVLHPRFRVAVVCTIPVLTLAMGPMVGLPVHAWVAPALSGWIQFALTSVVFFWSGWFFLGRFVESWRELDFNMFTLTVLGTGTAYAFSTVALLFPDLVPPSMHGGPELYFEAAAVITTIVLLGQILEQHAHARTNEAIRGLLDLTPETASRLVDGGEEEVSVEQVQIGDRLRMRPGQRVPVDGHIVEGSGAIDESMLSGESIPVEKTAGDSVAAGTLSSTGSFVMEVTKVGAETVLARIVEMVREAQESEPPVQRLVDRVSAIFVPAVLGVALISFVGWMVWAPSPAFGAAVVHAVAVLVIACPCALGLATPVSISTGIGRGATVGVLVKHAGALEALRQVDTLMFDKTGTLTEGRPQLIDIALADGWAEADLLALAALAEQLSEDPLARAVVRAAIERKLPIANASEFGAIAGGGLQAVVAGRPVLMGSDKLLSDRGCPPTDAGRSHAARWQGDGTSVIHVAVDSRYAGVLALRDQLKGNARTAVGELHRLGVQVVMVTGDNRAAAQAIATAAGIDVVHAEIDPAGKQKLVRETKARGRRVAFAGDGINDAPALALADVGIAVGTGTGVAIESAGLVLAKGDLHALVRALRLSRAVMRNLKQNLFFAFFYNVLGIPVAAGVLYPVTGWSLNPMLAGVAMSLSSLSVVTNALRLRRVPL